MLGGGARGDCECPLDMRRLHRSIPASGAAAADTGVPLHVSAAGAERGGAGEDVRLVEVPMGRQTTETNAA